MAKTNITQSDVAKIAKLANLTITLTEEALFADQFSETIDIVNQLNEIDTKDVPPTDHVTDVTNITRDDVVLPSLSQEEALKNAKSKHNGFFKVKAILEQ